MSMYLVKSAAFDFPHRNLICASFAGFTRADKLNYNREASNFSGVGAEPRVGQEERESPTLKALLATSDSRRGMAE